MGKFLDDLLGAWELVSYYREEDGRKTYPLGRDPKGYLLYTADGYMSAQLMRAEERPSYSLGGLHQGTQAEMAEAAQGYHAYSGRFEVDEKNQTVYHHNTVSLIPNRVGAVQDHQINKDGDYIDITSTTSPTHIKWKKVNTLLK